MNNDVHEKHQLYDVTIQASQETLQLCAYMLTVTLSLSCTI